MAQVHPCPPTVIVDSKSAASSRSPSPTKSALIAELSSALGGNDNAMPRPTSLLSADEPQQHTKSTLVSRTQSPYPEMKLSPKVLALLEDEFVPPEGWSKARMYVHKRFPPTDHKKKVMKQLFDIETPEERQKEAQRKISAPPSLNPILLRRKEEERKRRERGERVPRPVWRINAKNTVRVLFRTLKLKTRHLDRNAVRRNSTVYVFMLTSF